MLHSLPFILKALSLYSLLFLQVHVYFGHAWCG